MTYQYLLLSRNTPGDLNDSVNHALLNGWELWGAPFWGHSYCQALVKWEEKSEGSKVSEVSEMPEEKENE